MHVIIIVKEAKLYFILTTRITRMCIIVTLLEKYLIIGFKS